MPLNQRVMTIDRATINTRNTIGKTILAMNVLLASFPSAARSPPLRDYNYNYNKCQAT